METRQGMNEKTGQAVFKGTVLSVQRRAHASCSGGCGQMVTATATGNMLPVAASPVKRGQATLSSTTHLYHTQSYQTQRNIHQEWKDRPASMHVCHLLLTPLISIIKCLQHASIKNFCQFSQANPLSCSATITIHQVHFRIFNAQ